jgi:hypothetical protein
MSIPRRISRTHFERGQGVAFDVLLIAVAIAVSEEVVQAWLFDNPQSLSYGLSFLHLVTFPALFTALVLGYGRTGTPEEFKRQGPGLLGWASALFFGCSFIVPGVLGLLLNMEMWLYMLTIFGPYLLTGLWIGGILWAEARGLRKPLNLDEKPPWFWVQALALLTWAYLVWTEAMLLVAACKSGPIVTVGLPLGVLVGYLPARVMLYYVRDPYRGEVHIIAASVLHLLVRLMIAVHGG